MEQLPNQQDILIQGKDNQMKGLEEKIKVMWKTIEDLKIKVMEEKELLKKEKGENERMMEEQVKLRKQLSMFHLPHCPAYNTPPCPVHSFKSQTFTDSKSQSDTHFADQKDGVIENAGDSAEKHSFEELMRSLDRQPEASLENLFEECRQPSVPNNAQNWSSNFTLLMSEQWQSRVTAANARAKESKHQSLTFEQVDTAPYTFEFDGVPQLSNPSNIYPNL